jgi:hypothetical protein
MEKLAAMNYVVGFVETFGAQMDALCKISGNWISHKKEKWTWPRMAVRSFAFEALRPKPPNNKERDRLAAYGNSNDCPIKICFR